MPLVKINPLSGINLKSNFHHGRHSFARSTFQTRLIRKFTAGPPHLGKPFAKYNEAYQWMCNYFRNPQPDLVVPAIRELVNVSSTTVLIGAHKHAVDEPRHFHVETLFTFPLVGFMGELFKRNPGLTYEWFRGFAKIAQDITIHPFSAHSKTFEDVLYLSLIIAGTKQGHHVLHSIIKTAIFKEIAHKITGADKKDAMYMYIKQISKENPVSAQQLQDELQQTGRVPERHLAAALDSKIPAADVEKEYKATVERLMKWGGSSSSRISILLGRFRATGDTALIHQMMDLFQITIDRLYQSNNTNLYKFFTTQFRNMLRNYCRYDTNMFGILINEQKNIKQSDMRLLIGDLIDEKEDDDEEQHSYIVKDGKHLKTPKPGQPIKPEWKKQHEEALDRMTQFTQKDFPFIQHNARKPPQKKRRMDDDDDDDYDDDDDDDEED